MFQALVNIFAILGAGCFIAGGVVVSIVYWAYLELEKEASPKQVEKWAKQQRDEWNKRIEEEFSLDSHTDNLV